MLHQLSLLLSIKKLFARINLLFLLIVAFPTVAAAIFYGLIASDVYISESRFVVRSPEKQTPSALGVLLKGAGFSKSQDDTYAVHDYMLSRDALRQLDEKLGLSTLFAEKGIDRISRFGGFEDDRSFETFHKYYQKRVVDISLDGGSSISTLRVRAFTAEDSQRINAMLLEMGERMVNQMNERGRQDMIRYASNEAAEAEKRAKSAALALSTYRNKKGVFDPEKQSAIQLQQISKLQDELISTRTQLAQIRSVSRKNPQLPVLQKRIDVLQGEITAETAKVMGGDRSLSDKAAEYERLALERAFADKQLATALASLEQARNEAQRKQLYLERIVQPGKPDKAVEPRRLRSVLTVFVVGMICWGVLTMLIAGVREHHD